jgi:hypothetical protein
MVAPTTPRDARVKKRLREFFNGSPDFPLILNHLVLVAAGFGVDGALTITERE